MTKDPGKAFSADKATSGVKKVIKLTVEFPLRAEEDHPNDLALYFKRFATILFASDPTMAILNWDHPEQNPIRRSKDIDCNEKAIQQYYSGIVIRPSQKQITGFVKVSTSIPFRTAKGNQRLWTWLLTNKVFIRQTQLT